MHRSRLSCLPRIYANSSKAFQPKSDVIIYILTRSCNKNLMAEATCVQYFLYQISTFGLELDIEHEASACKKAIRPLCSTYVKRSIFQLNVQSKVPDGVAARHLSYMGGHFYMCQMSPIYGKCRAWQMSRACQMAGSRSGISYVDSM